MLGQVNILILFSVFFTIMRVFSIENSQPMPSETSRQRLSNHYCPYFLSIIQIVYGTEGIISQGGIASIDAMFEGVDLNGKKILEVGSGFGGVDIYLAQKYDVEVVGVEIEPYMTIQAEKLLAKHEGSLKGHVSFQILKERTSLSEFSDNTFDIVFLKEVLYHVPLIHKQQYVNEIFRVLKPSGKMIAEEWLSATIVPGEYLQHTIENGFGFLITPEQFLTTLENANFACVSFKDMTNEHIAYNKEDLSRLSYAEDLIRQKFGNDAYYYTLNAWSHWQKAMEQKELLSGIFIGTKN